MTIQEEVDRILTRHTGCTGIHLDVVKRELSEAGVVIKVERELPASIMEGQESFDRQQMVDRLERLAGYVAVEPLIGDK